MKFKGCRHASTLDLRYMEVRDAYRLFVTEATSRDIETSVLASSSAKTLRFYRELEGGRSYFFSCDRARAHLCC